jgi:hypothetical protein
MSLQKNSGAVRRFARLMRFSTWLQGLPNRLTPAPFRLLQIGSAFWQSRALYVAARLDIATLLADETLAAEEIARRLAVDTGALYRLLRMLVAMGIFVEEKPRRFGNNSLSNCLRQDNPGNMRPMILLHNSEEMSRPWYQNLEQGVRRGRVPFELAHGEELFSYLDRHHEFDALFAQAMDSVEALTGDSFATDFDWGRYERLIDVGGSKGAKSVTILKRHPALRALVVDREPVVRNAAHHWRGRVEQGILDRLSFQPGDLFEPLPPAAGDREIYLLSAVLHGFDDESCVRVLQNVAAAAHPAKATIALMELVLPERGADSVATSLDMQMLVNTRGRERTLGEWQTLFQSSGLVLDEVVSLRSFVKILVLRTRVV